MSKNRALEACVKYEAARKEILHLTEMIGEASEVDCKDRRDDEQGLFGTDCIERLWGHNKAVRAHDEWVRYCELHDGMYVEDDPEDPAPDRPEAEAPILCSRCAEVDSLVQARKAAKKKYGAAKRFVSSVGRTEIKRQSA